MKSILFNLWQTASQRLLFCVMVSFIGTLPMAAQTEDDEIEEEVEVSVKQPARKAVKENYPLVTLRGIVNEKATGKPLSGIQLQALGHQRYTSMTDEDGMFTIRVPEFTTALYVHAQGYASQQVAVVAGDTAKYIAINMLSDKFQPMYDKGTNYTAKSTATINRFGVTVDNEISSKLGADVRTVMRSAALDGGALMFIRGLNSITADAQPLIIIDGIEQDMQRDRYSLHDGQNMNMLANIAPDDIESIMAV